MSDDVALLLTLPAVADLARVQRPVVSMWRSRFRDADAPFPEPVATASGRELFDARQVAEWLVSTGHGKNPDAVRDAAFHSVIEGFDVADPAHIDAATALIALRALTGGELVDIAAIGDAARTVDPDDRMLLSELDRTLPPEWLAFVDAVVDADFTPAAAHDRMVARGRAHRSADGDSGAVTTDAAALVTEVALALGQGNGAAFAAAGDGAEQLVWQLADAADERDDGGFVVTGEAGAARRLRRAFAVRGLPLEVIDDERGRTDRIVHVARYPSASAGTADDIARAIDDLVLAMTDADRAVVLAPASVLTDALPREAELLRSDVLRSGRVRGIVRLPEGLVVSAPRQALALWVLGREHGDVPIGERFTVVADVSDRPLTPATRADIVSDLVAALGDAQMVRGHAFRFARFVPTATLLAQQGSLVDAATGRPVATLPSRAPRDIPALIDDAIADLGAEPSAGVAITPAVRGDRRARVTLGGIVAAGDARLLSGTRVAPDEIGAEGFGVIGVDELAGTHVVGDRAVDRLLFAERHPRARLTEPGDVVFITGPRPRAWVDAEGAHVVEFPARALRFDPSSGVVPEIAALDINMLPPTSRAWRRWLLRRVAPDRVRSVRAAFKGVDAVRARLRARLEAADRLTELIAEGAASAVIDFETNDRSAHDVA